MTDEIESTSERREKRLLDAAERTTRDPATVTFQHSVLAQTGLPYRNPGDDVREWERSNGQVALKVIADEAFHPELCRFVPLGLPYGPKPRLILAHLNGEALRHRGHWRHPCELLRQGPEWRRADRRHHQLTTTKSLS